MDLLNELQARYRTPVGCDSGRYGIIFRSRNPQSDLIGELARVLREDKKFQEEMDKALREEINSGIIESGGLERF